MQIFFDLINDFIVFFNDLPDKSDAYWERIIVWLLISYLEAKLFFLEISYEIASALIDSIGLSDAINSAWSNIPSAPRAVMTYLKIPEAINMIMSAYVTRFLLGLLP